ncbi:HAD family hydrolase [Pseudopedobacter beijingensis]|uniref:HAD family hydrolase n=1 Tax=Pseudopedobacter beijingensis TaxID=1207056 RepID=A0ABW4IAV4_9SPHI
MKYGAYLFDLNGTVIDDMHFHGRAWKKILSELGADLTYDEVVLQMYGKNAELLERVFGAGHFSDAEVEKISIDKEKAYQEAYRPEMKLIDGLGAFLEKAHQAGIKMAIGSAAIPFNIDFILDNLNIRKYFDVIVSADDVDKSKPHPQTFTKAADILGVEYSKCLVFEDAPKGIEAAANAGMDAVAITTLHPEEDFFRYSNIITFIANYSELELL